jgi:hypothetical protein
VDLSPRQRSAVFVAVVIALAALGYYLVVPALTHARGSARAASTPASAPSSAGTPTEPAATVPISGDTSGVNIYNWLPFTQQDLNSAASVAVQFSIDYNTFTYTENAAGYVGAMGSLITDQLGTTLQAAYQTPGVAQLRRNQKQVSTGTAAINSLRAFGPSSMTFIVTAGQRLVTSKGTSSGSTQYAVTVTGSGTSWQVSDIELESAGNS